MNQQKTSEFLKRLRKEKGLTQEQVAEHFCISSRTVSRWETGANLPDLQTLIELADYYNVEILEIIDGERKSETMDSETKNTLKKIAEYTDAEKTKLLDRVYLCGLCSALIFAFILISFAYNLYQTVQWINDLFFYSIVLGLYFSFSTIITGAQLTGKMSKDRLKRISKIALPVLIIATILVTCLCVSFLVI